MTVVLYGNCEYSCVPMSVMTAVPMLRWQQGNTLLQHAFGIPALPQTRAQLVHRDLCLPGCWNAMPGEEASHPTPPAGISPQCKLMGIFRGTASHNYS